LAERLSRQRYTFHCEELIRNEGSDCLLSVACAPVAAYMYAATGAIGCRWVLQWQWRFRQPKGWCDARQGAPLLHDYFSSGLR